MSGVADGTANPPTSPTSPSTNRSHQRRRSAPPKSTGSMRPHLLAPRYSIRRTRRGRRWPATCDLSAATPSSSGMKDTSRKLVLAIGGANCDETWLFERIYTKSPLKARDQRIRGGAAVAFGLESNDHGSVPRSVLRETEPSLATDVDHTITEVAAPIDQHQRSHDPNLSLRQRARTQAPSASTARGAMPGRAGFLRNGSSCPASQGGVARLFVGMIRVMGRKRE